MAVTLTFTEFWKRFKGKVCDCCLHWNNEISRCKKGRKPRYYLILTGSFEDAHALKNCRYFKDAGDDPEKIDTIGFRSWLSQTSAYSDPDPGDTLKKYILELYNQCHDVELELKDLGIEVDDEG